MLRNTICGNYIYFEDRVISLISHTNYGEYSRLDRLWLVDETPTGCNISVTSQSDEPLSPLISSGKAKSALEAPGCQSDCA